MCEVREAAAHHRAVINADDGYQLWSERYDREMEMRDIFEVQDEITLAVVDALKLKLTGAERSGVLRHHTENVKAHELYLKGRFQLFRMSPSGIQSGMCTCKRRSKRIRPTLMRRSVLHTHIACIALSLEMPPNEVLPKAKAAARKAIELDRDSRRGPRGAGFNIFWHEWTWNTAEKHFRRALELNPNSADAHWMFAHLRSNTGWHEEALAEIAYARELDPLSGLMNAMEGQFLLHAGRTDDALARLQEALALDSNSRVAHLFAASACIEKGLFTEAIAEAHASSVLSPGSSQAIAFEAYANAKLGNRVEARAALDQVLQVSRERFVPPYHIAIIYSGLDETAEALTWLERGFEQRDPKMVFLKVEPKWNNLRDDPRFIRLLKGMNLFP